jgi:hypothetical protein
MGFLDKAKAAAEQAAAKAKEGVEDVQAKRELSQAYNELGKTAFELVEGGVIADSRLDGHAEKIRALQARAAGDEVPVGVSTAGASDGEDASQPPAMPT